MSTRLKNLPFLENKGWLLRSALGRNVMRRKIIAFSIVAVFVLLFPLVGSSQPLPTKITADKERMIKTVQFLSQDCFPRSEKEQYEKAAQFIEEHFRRSKLEVSQQPYGDKYNVIGIKKVKTNKRVIIGAHYDTVPVTPGADDNASGVAVLIELAYLLQNAPQLDCDIELVAWNSEEPPYFTQNAMGSYAHADALKKSIKTDGIEVVAMLCMDLVGYYTDEDDSQKYPSDAMRLLYGSKGDFLAVAGRTADAKTTELVRDVIAKGTKLKAEVLTVPEADKMVIAFSDHINYWDIGCPVIFLTDTAFYRNANYHRATDTWNTLDYDKMVELANGLYGVTQTICGTPQ